MLQKDGKPQPALNDDLNIAPVKEDEQPAPLMFVDLFFDGESQDDKVRLTINRGDSAHDVAKRFCEEQGFDQETQDTLEAQLNQKMQKVERELQRIPELPELASGPSSVVDPPGHALGAGSAGAGSD